MSDSGLSMHNKKRIKNSDNLFRAAFLFPAVFLLAVFMFYPIFETFRISLTKSSGLGDEVFIGLKNYTYLFSNEAFRAGLLHVFQWAVCSVLIQIPFAFFIAYVCVSYNTKLVKALRSVYYLGNVIPITIISMLGLFIIMPNVGAIVTLAEALGWQWLADIDFIGNPDIAFWTLFAMATWAYIGFGIVYLMANIDQIPKSMTEAAVIDGANKFQIAWHITIPNVAPALRIQALLSIVGSIKLFDLPWLVTVGGPGDSTTTLGIVLYKEGFLNWQYGKGAAVGVIIFILSLFFTIIMFSFNKKEE